MCKTRVFSSSLRRDRQHPFIIIIPTLPHPPPFSNAMITICFFAFFFLVEGKEGNASYTVPPYLRSYNPLTPVDIPLKPTVGPVRRSRAPKEVTGSHCHAVKLPTRARSGHGSRGRSLPRNRSRGRSLPHIGSRTQQRYALKATCQECTGGPRHSESTSPPHPLTPSPASNAR